jgi:uncharacterized protein (UPF0333 family)
MLKKIRKVQSTLEYTLLFTALVLAFIYAADKVFKQKAKAQADLASDILDTAHNKIAEAMGIGNTENPD